MKEKIEQLISYSQSSLYFSNEAFNEIWHITQTPNSKEEYDIVAGYPFGFYGITLQYCFIMEYTKLLDTNTSNENENVASLSKLNKSTRNFLGDTFEPQYLENKRLLNDITNSDLYKRLKKLRNKKFGHADSDEINNPWKIEGFTGEQIEEMRSQIEVLLKIFNNILGAVSDASFGLHDDDRTANFIRFHAKYKQYYFKNYMKAMEEGYGLH
jgi:AbiU2